MSTAVLPVHVGLVDDTGRVVDQLPGIAGALNEQVQADFSRDWGVSASVGAYTPDSLPQGCWAVRIRKTLDQPGALGYHTDENNQPVSYVELSSDYTNDYTITVSHELLEMLADPFGNRVHLAAPPQSIDPAQIGITPQDRVSFLVEVCDPCERASYQTGGFAVSDYMLPRWYRTAPGRNRWFSHLGTCTEPRQVADGGYVSFSRADGTWFQVFNENGALSVQNLGKFSRAQYGSLREFADVKAREYRTRT